MSSSPWIAIAPPEQSTGDLRRAYDRILETRGRIPEIRSVMAGEPLVVEGFAYFYPENNYACRSIDRRLAEWRDKEIANRIRILKITLWVSVIVAGVSLIYLYIKTYITPHQ